MLHNGYLNEKYITFVTTCEIFLHWFFKNAVNRQNIWEKMLKNYFSKCLHVTWDNFIHYISVLLNLNVLNYTPSLKKRSHQLIVTLYTLPIYLSLHNKLVRTLFEGRPVYYSVIFQIIPLKRQNIWNLKKKDTNIFLSMYIRVEHI